MTTNNFWQHKELSEFTPAEWESICTNCGQCCLLKLQDDETDDIYYTDVVCQYFNCQDRLCTCYKERCALVPSCLKLTPQNLDKINWIPRTCAYNILNKTGELPIWHPRVSGKPIPAEYAIPQNVISELLVSEDNLEDHIIEDDNDD